MLQTLLTVAVLHAALLIVPGPDVLFVSRAAAAHSRRAALLAGLGVSLSIACWAGFALLGVQAIFAAFPWIHTFIRVAGGLYLLWMGLQLWRASSQDAGGEERRTTPALNDRQAFRRGFLTNLGNPKPAVFFGSVFSNVIGAHASSALKTGAFGVIVALSIVWFVLVAYGMSAQPVQRAYLRAKRSLDRVAGTLLAGFGALLLAQRERG
ncbi:LysE family transporter [Deinococcus sp.]|uniref:LysE family transporter n=1 Tax=Deinococcus sp. TaxID=47478 RepID=UPI003CC6316D